MNKSPEALFEERERRGNEAVALKEPDRIPVMVLSGFFPAHYGGITCEEAISCRLLYELISNKLILSIFTIAKSSSSNDL